MARRLAYYVTVPNETGEMHTFGPDDKVPAWAVKAITNPSAWGDDEAALEADDEADDDDESQSYDDLGVPELKALVEERQLEVTGTGKDGNVVKADLVAALEADDEADDA